MSKRSATVYDTDPQAPGLRDMPADQTARLYDSADVVDALILDAHLRQSLVSIRSLGRRGLRVAALATAGSVPAFASRWCRAGFSAPSYDSALEPYRARLAQVLERTRPGVLITSSDGTLDLIRRHRESLEREVRIALAREPALEIAVNKERTLDIARRLGLHVPRGVPVRGPGDVAAALREIGLPAVVKPAESWVRDESSGVRFASHLVTTADEARRAVENLTAMGASALFQQFLPGRREAISFLYAHGTVYARFAQWAKRTQPPLGGLSVLRQSIAIPWDIGEQAEQLVREIELDGYSEVEFRRDIDGTPYLMEINPRLSASVEVAVRAGVDFPALLYQWAHGDALTPITAYRIGGWMRFLMADITTTIEALEQRGRPGIPSPARTLMDFSTAFLIPAGYDYLDWTDPLPALAATVGSMRSLAPRVGRRLLRRPLSRFV